MRMCVVCVCLCVCVCVCVCVRGCVQQIVSDDARQQQADHTGTTPSPYHAEAAVDHMSRLKVGAVFARASLLNHKERVRMDSEGEALSEGQRTPQLQSPLLTGNLQDSSYGSTE